MNAHGREVGQVGSPPNRSYCIALREREETKSLESLRPTWAAAREESNG